MTVRYLPAADIYDADEMMRVFNSALNTLQRTDGTYLHVTPDVAIQDFREHSENHPPVNLYRVTIEKVETTQ